jgi:hypothetical protein
MHSPYSVFLIIGWCAHAKGNQPQTHVLAYTKVEYKTKNTQWNYAVRSIQDLTCHFAYYGEIEERDTPAVLMVTDC